MTIHRCAAAAFTMVLVMSCFNPRPQPGIGCDPEGRCPPNQICSTDFRCHPIGGPEIDASPPPDSMQPPPDATPVGCQDDIDCQNPPACATRGTCNLTSHTCVFGTLDCSSMDDPCNVGVCSQSTGECIKRSARQGLSCGQDSDCVVDACGGFADAVCDSTGTQTQTCTRYTCQSGTCTGGTSSETLPCTRPKNEGAPCGSMMTVVTCDPCIGATGCALDGTQDCRSTTPVCQGDSCQDVSTSSTQMCSRIQVGGLCRQGALCPSGDPRLLCCAANHTCSVSCPESTC
jgi:hypothetical protein